MAISKLILNGVVQMDVTQDTVITPVLQSGYTAHSADGEAITGTSSGGGNVSISIEQLPGGGEHYIINGTATTWTANEIARAKGPSGAVTLTVPYVSGYNADGIRAYAFYGNTEITSITLDTFPNIYNYAFANMPALTTVSSSVCTTFGNRGFSASSYVFSGCSALTTVNVPLLNSLGAYQFNACTSLTTLVFPKLSSCATNGTFIGCTSLQSVDFGSPAKLGNADFFKNCSSLTTVILRTTSVCTLPNTAIFAGTPFASGGSGGTVYVPSSLVSSYQTSTNWSTLYSGGTCTFAAIEGSTYETHYVDGTTISS